MMKRVLSFTLALALVFSLVPPRVFAQEEAESIKDQEILAQEEPAAIENAAWEGAYDSLTEFEITEPETVEDEVSAPELGEDAPASGTCGDNVTWVLIGGTLTISGTGPMNGSHPWSASRDLITAVVIESGVTTVGSYAFNNCKNLTSVSLPNTLTEIENSAFSNCSGLSGITIPQGVTAIGDKAFMSCSGLTGITLPDTLTSLGMAAFRSCTGLKSITVPASVTELGEGVFYRCNGLEKVDFLAKAAIIPKHTFQYCESLTAIKIPEGVTTIETNAFAVCSALADVQLPNTLTTLGNDVFTYCDALTSISLPDSITSMDSGMFSYCRNLKEVKLPKNLEVIESYFFANCTSLETVVFPENVKTLKDNIFVCCYGLTEMDLPDTVVSMERAVFWYCDNLESVDLPANLETIETSAFAHCINLETVHFPAKVSGIAVGLFPMCEKLMTITVDEANPNYCADEAGVLYNKSKTELIAYPPARTGAYTIPGTVTVIGAEAFDCAAVTAVNIPESVTEIGDYAFYRTTDLGEVKLPGRLRSAGKYAFSRSSICGTVEIPGTLSEVSASMFDYSGRIEKVILHEGVKTVGKNAFSDCGIKELSLPSTLTKIEEYGFFRNRNLTEVVIPQSVTFLGGSAFGACDSLKRVYFKGDLPESCEGAISNYWYGGTHIEMAATVYFRGDNETWTLTARQALKNNNSGIAGFKSYLEYDENYIDYGSCGENVMWTLKKDGKLTVFLEDDMTPGLNSVMANYPMGQYPWEDHKEDIGQVVIKECVTSVGDFAFAGCANLAKISIADTVSKIGSYAFLNCEKLESFTLGKAVTELGRGFLSNCKNLKNLEVASGNTCFVTDFEGILYDAAVTRLILAPAGVDGTCYLPETLSSVDDFAFSLANNLKEIVFQGNGVRFESSAFADAKLIAYYPVLDTTWTKDILLNYGGEITWTPYDDTLHFGADVQLHKKLENLTLFIRPKMSRSVINDTPVMRDLDDVTMYCAEDALTLEKGKVGFVIAQEQAVLQDIVLKREGYQDYVIPKAVSASVASLATDANSSGTTQHSITAYMKTLKSGRPYVSTVFGRQTNSEDIYLELTNNELRLEEGSRHDIIMTVVGAEGKRVQYFLSQGAGHEVYNYSGVFTNQNLYGTFDYDHTVKAYAVVDGKIYTDPVELQIKKMQPMSQETKNFLKSTTFNLLGKDGQAIEIPEDFPLVGGGKISLEAFKFPLGVDLEGTSLKISFGIDVFSKGYQDGKWEKDAIWRDFKKEFTMLPKAENGFQEGITKGKEELDIYRTFKEKFSDKYSGYYDTAANFNVDFVGYLEAEIMDGKPVIKEVVLSVGGVFTFRYTQQGAIWVVPAYFYVEVGASLRATGKGGRFLPDNAIPMQLDLTLGLEPQLRLGGGVGVANAISGGIYGEGKLPITGKFPDKYVQVKISGEFGIEGQFFVLKGDVALLKGEHILFERYFGENAATVSALLYGAPPAEESEAVLVSRDYTKSTSDWLGDGAVPYALSQSGAAFTPLQTDIFNLSQPKVAAIDGGLILVWVEDDTTRDTYNRMRLVYSLYDKNTGLWSEPKPVADDGHNDGYPTLVSNGTNAWVAWQKINKTLTPEDCAGIDALLENSEIFLAKFDGETGSFAEAQQLTNNKLYDYGPSVALENGYPTVYYGAVAPEQVNESKAHTLRRYVGKTGKTSDQKTKRNYLLSIVADNGYLAFVEDADGDVSTTNDINVYSVGSYTTNAFNKNGNEVAYSYAGYGMLNANQILFVSDMANIYYRYNYATHKVFESNRSITGNINILNGENGPIILWTESGETGNELYMVSYNGSGWTAPVKVSDQGRTIRDVCAVLLDGQAVGVCNRDTARNTTDLDFFRISDFADISLLGGIYFREDTAVPGENQTFRVILRNQGTQTVDRVVFAVSDTLGTKHSVTEDVNLEPGCVTDVEITYPVPETYAGTTLTVEAAIPDVRDADLSNNTLRTSIGKPDLSIREDSVHIVKGGYAVNVLVENQSLIPARGVKLVVKLGDNFETAVFTQTVGDLDRSSYANVSVGIPTEQLVFEDGVARVYLTVESDSADAADVDNTVCVLILQPKETVCGHTWVDATCQDPKHCVLCGETQGQALGHRFQNGSCSVCGEPDPDYVNPDTPDPTDPPVTEPDPTDPPATEPDPTDPKPTDPKPSDPETPDTEGVTRLAGENRIITSFLVADQLKEKTGVEKFENIIVASGSTFADALPGSYLSAVKNAPILLTLSKQKYIDQTADYIRENLVSGGTVYILGGESAVPASMEKALEGMNVQRVAGKDRFGTNLEILKTAGVKPGEEILVCTAKEFADSLSASAVGKPILLVYKKITQEQTAYLQTLSGNSFVVVGGTNAVPDSLAQAIGQYGSVERLAGKDRLETSTMVADRYFRSASAAVAAYGWNFPDGLCGGSLAYSMKAPLILTHSKTKLYTFTADYTTKAGLKAGYVLGGEGLVSDEATRAIFGMGSEPIRILE